MEIELVNGGVAIVDPEWYEWLASMPWKRTARGYAKCRDVAMHRMVCGLPILPAPELAVHHINENKLDNRRINLVVCTPQEHMAIHRFMRSA